MKIDIHDTSSGLVHPPGLWRRLSGLDGRRHGKRQWTPLPARRRSGKAAHRAINGAAWIASAAAQCAPMIFPPSAIARAVHAGERLARTPGPTRSRCSSTQGDRRTRCAPRSFGVENRKENAMRFISTSSKILLALATASVSGSLYAQGTPSLSGPARRHHHHRYRTRARLDLTGMPAGPEIEGFISARRGTSCKSRAPAARRSSSSATQIRSSGGFGRQHGGSGADSPSTACRSVSGPCNGTAGWSRAG